MAKVNNLHPVIQRSELLPHEQVILDIELLILDWPIEILEDLYGKLLASDPAEGLSDESEKGIQQMILKKEQQIVKRQIRIATNSKDDKLAVDTGNKLLDRAKGKAAQQREIEDTDDIVTEINFTNYAPGS